MTERKHSYGIYMCRKDGCGAPFTTLAARKLHERRLHPGEDFSDVIMPIKIFDDKDGRDDRVRSLRGKCRTLQEVSEELSEEVSEMDVEETPDNEEEISIVLKDVIVPVNSAPAKVKAIEQVEHVPEPVLKPIPEPVPEPKPMPEPEPKLMPEPEPKPKPEVVTVYKRKNIIDDFCDWFD